MLRTLEREKRGNKGSEKQKREEQELGWLSAWRASLGST